MKVKLITDKSIDGALFEEAINDFIKGKEIIDIKMLQEGDCCSAKALIMYQEQLQQ